MYQFHQFVSSDPNGGSSEVSIETKFCTPELFSVGSQLGGFYDRKYYRSLHLWNYLGFYLIYT